MEPVTVFIVFVLGSIVGIMLSRFSHQKAPTEPELLAPQLLNIQEGSIVVLRTPGAVSAENALRLKKHWETFIAPGTKCLVLGDGMSINCVLDPSKR